MALFRRRTPPTPTVDVDALAKALTPAVAAAAANSHNTGITPGGATYPTGATTANGLGALANALPRPNSDFNSLFGPGYPLIPDPLDPPGPNGRTTPRRSQFLVAWNMQLVDRQVPWTMLRWLAEDCDIVNRCIQLTQDEMCGKEWGFGFSSQILAQIMGETGETNTAKATAIARDKYGEELMRVQQFFEYPDRDMNQSFTEWLQALLWDHLVYDGVAIYPRYNMGGDLRNLELIDASTIKLYRDNAGRVPQPPAPAYAQILYGFPRGEYQNVADEADAEYRDDQLAYFIRRPRNTSVYGYPQVEEVMALATTYLARQAWMRAEYTAGAMPKSFMKVGGADQWTPEQYTYFNQLLNDVLAGQTDKRQSIVLLRPDMEPVFAPQIDEHYKSDYDNWLISQIGARFGRPASMLGVQAKAGLSGGKQMSGEMDQTDVYSGAAIEKWVIKVINNLCRRYLGVGPEITATCNDGGTVENQVQEAQADASDVAQGIVTRNEIRAKRGIPILDMPEADQLGVTTGTGVTFLSGAIAQQEAAAATPGVPDPNDPDSDTPAAGPTEQPPAATNTSTTTDGDAPPPVDDDKTPEAAKELDRFGRFADRRIAKGAWRDFTFTHTPPDLAARLNDLGRTATVAKQDPARDGDHDALRFYVRRLAKTAAPKAGGLPKAGSAARRTQLEDRVHDHYQPKLADELTRLHPNVAAHAEATATTLAHKLADLTPPAATDDGATAKAVPGLTPAQEAAIQAALARLRSTQSTAPDATEATLKALYGDAWHVGTGTATEQIPTVTTTVDWDNWTPGSTYTAEQAGPLADLLDQADTVIQGVTDTQMDRILAAIRQGIVTGQTPGQVADAVNDVVGNPNQATMIARTETARAVEAAAQQTYSDNGVGQWDWLASPGACPVCLDNEAGGPYDVGSGPDLPAHPNCRCTSTAHFDDGSAA